MKKYIILSAIILTWCTPTFGIEPPKFSSVKTFKLYFKEGIGLTLKAGELEEKTSDKKFSANGELTYSITGEGKALMIGNAGSSEIALIPGDSSLIFIERTLSGNMHVLTVFSTWNKKVGGFACAYNRCTNAMGDVQMISTYYGIAKPWD
jgi:hypothetical protein